MKRIFLFLLMYFALSNLKAQDVIILLTGDEIKAKVIEVGHDEIKYVMNDMLEGPTNSILKKSVFMIKYENGAKEVFNNGESTPDENWITRSDITYIANEEFSKYLVEHNWENVIYDYQINVERVKSTNRIYYYGIDMTPLVLINPEKVGTEILHRPYITSWVTYLNSEIPPEKYLRKRLKKEELITRFDQINERNIRKGGIWILNEYEDGLPVEYAQELIYKYVETIEEETGVGFVIIMDCFNKEEEEAIGIFCFFDIETGNILWATKTTGEGTGMGMKKHWAFGTLNSLKTYIRKVYNKNR